MKGKLVVLYGANNLGKSTQIALLEDALYGLKIPTQRVKYPVYDLKPTGPLINAVLREGRVMSEQELQKTYVQNRRDYEPILKETLSKGTTVIAEDYIGTGIAWGLVRGLQLEELEEWNKGLLREDIMILLDGERFKTGREAGHRNEVNDLIWQKAREAHLLLAKRYGWVRISANQAKKNVHKTILTIVRRELNV